MGEHAQKVTLRIKAVPGASRDGIAGMLGDRVKIRISAAPEGGKANKAIIKLLARSLNIKPTQLTLVSGHTNPEKVLGIESLSAAQISDALGFDASGAIC